MGSSILKSGGCPFAKDDIIVTQGAGTKFLSLLLQGKLDVYISSGTKESPMTLDNLRRQSYKLFELGQNVFIGANDLLRDGISSLSIVASSDSNLYAYESEDAPGMMAVINSQKDYGAYVINSLCIFIENSMKALKKINNYRKKTECFLENLCAYCALAAEEFGFTFIEGKVREIGTSRLAELKEKNTLPPASFSPQFIEPGQSFGDMYEEEPKALNKSDYYIHLLQVPTDIRKAFFGADGYIASEEIRDASECLDNILRELRKNLGRLDESIELLYSDHADSVYKILMKAVRQMKENGTGHAPVADAASYVLTLLSDISEYLETEFSHNTGIDIEYLEHVHKNSISAPVRKAETIAAAPVSSGSEEVPGLPDELIDSAQKILAYSEIPQEKVTAFIMNLSAFRSMKDKFSSDGSAKKIRSTLTDLYFEVYPAVLKKSCIAKDNSRLIRMFLSYGYMDEKLLDQGQVMDIFRLAGADHASGASNVYYMQEWLGKVYNMEKDPSVSHYGLDYADTFRELKKRGTLSDRDKAAYFANRDDRLAFENDNMFRQNHKICHGQISSYFPILHRDMAPQNPVRSHVSPAKIQEKLNRILEIDFSAFHREVNYIDQEKGIEKEIIMLQVVPDFILVPVYGSRAMMWQEISGKVKSSPGRLLLPVFTDDNLDDMLLKLVGNFRWELCRTVMGVAWNDITQPSLSSEYADYVQFFKKNKDLSEEAKEKIKALTDRHYNKLRDIFTSDYEVWINYESKGNPRLNKVARGIFSKYCPFSKEIREQLAKQPLFTECLAVDSRLRAKKARELESHYKIYTKQNSALDPELQKNLEFYRDL